MDKIKTVKIKNEDGTISDESYTITTDAKYVDMANGYNVQETIGVVNVGTDGSIIEQIDNVNNNLNKKAYYFNSVANMKAAGLKEGDYAVTLGYYEINDGGNGEYKIVNGAYTDNGGSYIRLNNGLYAELIVQREVCIKQFGAKGDSNNDDTIAIQNCVDFAFNSNLDVVVNGSSGYYRITLPIIVNIWRAAKGYWQGIANKILGENQANSRIVKIGNAVYTNHSNPNVNNVNATLICANTNVSMQKGTAVYLDSLSLENYDDPAFHMENLGYGLWTNVSRSTYKNLNIHAHSGIVAHTFSCLYENIVYGCKENALTLDTGTSNLFRFMYAPGCKNAYNISSSYSTLMNVCCDGGTGTIFSLSGMGLSLIDCGSESVKAQYIFKINSDWTTLYIHNYFLHRQTGDSANNLALEDCAILYSNRRCVVDIDGISIAEFSKIEDNHNSYFFAVTGVGSAMVTTSVKNIRYYHNYTGDNNPRIKMWNSRPGYQCGQRLSSQTQSFNYLVTGDNNSIYPFIGGYYNETDTMDERGNPVNPDNISATKTIWLDCKDQYHNEKGEEIRYTGRHKQGDIQLYNDPLARNALGLVITEYINTYTWNTKPIPLVLTGTTEERPTQNLFIGLQYFDTTLSKPVYYKGSNKWVDATGTEV